MRRLVPLLTALFLTALAAPAVAATAVDTTGTVYSTDKVVVPLVFPVIGPTSYSDTFLACRSGCTRKHMGEDLMGPKMSPLVAACDGTVVSQRSESAPGQGNYLVIACDHGPAAGWSAVYIHINNDTPGTDDGQGTAHFAFPSGIAPGVRVMAGQLVAWRGDSGDAESTGPHLHFELRKGSGWGGTVYSAFGSLNAARRLTVPQASGPHPDGTLIRTAQHRLYVVHDLHKRLVTPGVLAANRLSAAAAIDVSPAEAARYADLPPLWPRSGALLQDATGAVWRVLGAQRYAAVPLAGETVTVVPDSDLVRLTITDAPELPYTAGMLIATPDGNDEIGDDGLLHHVFARLLVSYGWNAADLHPWPADQPLPEVGEPLGLRDGTLVQVPGQGVSVVSGGMVRRIWDTRELVAYGYAGRPRLALDALSLAGLPLGELAGEVSPIG